MIRRKEILVWGATPEDKSPLFEYEDCEGPPAGQFRKDIREVLLNRFKERGFTVSFSEDAEKFGHHEENPGLYEPLQLKYSAKVLMLFPGNRAMAVNTWELALACETDKEKNPLHLNKLAFVIPKSMYTYIESAMKSGTMDPAEFKHPSQEPILGAQNSFAVRWIYLMAAEQFAKAGISGNPASKVVPILSYEDSIQWNNDNNLMNETLGRISNFVATYI